jgi:hypothetical protein
MVPTFYSIAAAICAFSGTWIIRSCWKRKFTAYDKVFEFSAVIFFLVVGAVTGHQSADPGFLLIMSSGLAIRSGWVFCRALYRTASLEFWYAIVYLVLGTEVMAYLHRDRVAEVCLLFLLIIPSNVISRMYLPKKGSRND